MKKVLMSPKEFAEYDEQIKAKILAYDPKATIETQLALFTIADNSLVEARAVWTVSGAEKDSANNGIMKVYNFALLLKDGYVWELVTEHPHTATTSGNQKHLDKVLRDFYKGLSLL